MPSQRQEKVLQLKHQQYLASDQKMKNFLATLTDREISMMSVSRFAREVGVSRSTVHHHKEIYQQFLEKKKNCL